VKWLNAISILTLVLSVGTLVITAAGTGSIKSADDSPPPSSPVVIDENGREVGALGDVLGAGEVGVMLVGAEAWEPDSSAPAESSHLALPSAKAKQSVSARSRFPPSKKPGRPSKKSKPLDSAGKEFAVSADSNECVDINAASESALTALKGIGPSLAARIVEYRGNAGLFKKKEDVMKVKGIGPAKFAAIEPFICL
jgi:competence protein ComEA